MVYTEVRGCEKPKQAWVTSQDPHWLAVWPWASHSASLGLRFLIWELGTTALPTPGGWSGSKEAPRPGMAEVHLGWGAVGAWAPVVPAAGTPCVSAVLPVW